MPSSSFAAALVAMSFLASAYSTEVKVGVEPFDFFVFATSWQPEFCYNQPTYAGCSSPDTLWSSQLTIHGAWPQNTTGAWPDTCTTEAFDVSVIDSIGIDTFYLNWPNVKIAQSDPTYSSFWQHEWEKHGTCSQMSQHDYFASVVAARPTTPSIIAASYGKTVSKAALISAYGTVVAPTCMSSTYLSEVYICVDKTFLPFDCPASVVAEGNCGDTINVGTFEDLAGPPHKKHVGGEISSQR